MFVVLYGILFVDLMPYWLGVFMMCLLWSVLGLVSLCGCLLTFW